jgi:prepilin peptidase CpaA
MTAEFALITFVVATPIAIAMIYFDVTTMTIPNWLTGGAFALFAALVYFGLGLDDFLQRLLGAGIVFAATFLFFALNKMGGGDAKAATGMALLVAPWDAGFVLILLAVLGLLLMGGYALARRASPGGITWATQLPYGVTLGAALIVYTALVAFLIN